MDRDSVSSVEGGRFARIGRADGIAVQLRRHRGAASAGPSASRHPGADGRDTGCDGARVGGALLSGIGRPSIAPQMLLRAMLLQAFYSVRSERQLMERMEFDLLFRWFVGLGADEPVWDASTFSKNRDRLLEGDVAARFLAMLMARPRVKRLLSSDHFSVDGTMIQAWSSMKSVKPIHPGASPGDEPPSSSGGSQCRDRLPRRDAHQRHACLDHRSRGQALFARARAWRPGSPFSAMPSWRTAAASSSTPA